MKNTTEQPAGDLETAINRYGDMLYRLCVLMLKNDSDAEDALQDTMLKYYQKAPAFENAEHEKAWLIRVAANRCRDLLRYRVRHPQIDDEALSRISCDSSDSAILEALTDLPEKYRLVLTLYYIEGFSIGQIAGIITRTPSAVKMRLHKGRILLKEHYRTEYL